MQININHTIRINYISSRSINNIDNFKEETIMDNASSCPNTHIHEVYNDTRALPIHVLSMYVKYKIIIGTNHKCNNARVSLLKASTLK